MGSYGRSYGSMRKPAETLRKPTEILRKSYGNFSKIKINKSCGNPTEIMRKLPHASACFRMLPQENKQKVRKIIEFFSAEAIFTLRKPCGSPAEGLRKSCGRPFRKSDLVRKLPQALIYNIAPLHPSSHYKIHSCFSM